MDAYSKTKNVSFSGSRSGVVSSYSGPTESGKIQRGDSSSIPSVVETFNGEKNPYWRQAIRSHGNATTFASGTKLEFSADKYQSGIIRHQESQNYRLYGVVSERSGIDGNESGYPPFVIAQAHYPASAELQSQVANSCIRKFISRFQDARSAFESGQDLGEWKETLSMIGHRGSQIRSGMNKYLDTLTKRLGPGTNPYKAARRIRKKSLRQRVVDKRIADLYLEYRFGWNPLIQDIKDGLSAIGRFSEPIVRISAHSSGKESVSNESDYLGSLHGAFTLSRSIQSYRMFEQRMIGGVRVRRPGEVESSLQKYQLLPQDWIPTLWDLLPYSWLLDYFVNIGDIIKGASFCTSDLAWGCKTVRSSTSTIGGEISPFIPYPPTLPDNWYFTDNQTWASGGNYEHTITTFSRAPINSLDFLPSFEFHIPTKARAWENMGALLVSRSSIVSKTLGRLYDLVSN